jgi:hypothetical protein
MLIEDFDKLFNRMVSHGALSKLSFNLVTAIKQVPSLAVAFGQVGTAKFLDAGFSLSRNRKETMDFIYSKAPDIENRYIGLEMMRAAMDLAEMRRSKSLFAHLFLMFTNQLFQFWNMVA